MSKADDLVYSPFSRTVTRDGITVDVRIYRDRTGAKWIIEVVHEGATVTIWNDVFDSDQEALEAFIAAANSDGMASFVGDGDAETIH